MEIEFIVKCDTCGKVLTATTEIRGHDHIIDVEPCEHCLDSVGESASRQSYEDGHNAGYDVGYLDGEKDATSRKEKE